MSELDQYNVYLEQRAKQAVVQVVEMYTAGLNASQSKQVLRYEERAKQETGLLLGTAAEIAVKGGIPFADVVFNLVSAWIIASKTADDDDL